MFKHILIPADGSALSTTAIHNALQLTRDAKAKATVITVMEPFHFYSMDSVQLADTRSAYETHAGDAAKRCLEAAKRQAEALGLECEAIHVEQYLEPCERMVRDQMAGRGVRDRRVLDAVLHVPC